MGACQSQASVGASSYRKSGSVALGPTPSILPRSEFDDVRECYDFDKELGRGTISTLFKVTNKLTGKVYLCKSLSKLKVTSQEELRDVKQEVKIFKHVASTEHPNVGTFVQSFEDKTQVHIITELCTGGDLFDRILRERSFGEHTAAEIFKSVIGMVRHCHAMNVIHRDIKPETFMYGTDQPGAPLKAVDFGVAAFCGAESKLEDLIGTPLYLAPEMLRGSYGREVDLWSCGVVLYILLCGYPPFQGSTDSETFEAIVSSPLNLKSEPWPKVSPAAKELVRKLLHRDPKRRFTADQVLAHRWFEEQHINTPDLHASPMVLARMQTFAKYHKFKKEALKVIAGGLPEAELEGLLNIFKSMDKDGSGNISVAELRKGMRGAGKNMGQTELSSLLGSLDTDGNQTIDYLEFVAATMKDISKGLSERDKQEHLMRAFKHFDLDGSSYITSDELMMVLSSQAEGSGKNGKLSQEEVDKILKEVDQDKDGKINYEEFCLMLRNNTARTMDPQYVESRRIRIDKKLTIKLREATMPSNDEPDETHSSASSPLRFKAAAAGRATKDDRESPSDPRLSGGCHSETMGSGELSGKLSTAGSLAKGEMEAAEAGSALGTTDMGEAAARLSNITVA